MKIFSCCFPRRESQARRDPKEAREIVNRVVKVHRKIVRQEIYGKEDLPKEIEVAYIGSLGHLKENGQPAAILDPDLEDLRRRPLTQEDVDHRFQGPLKTALTRLIEKNYILRVYRANWKESYYPPDTFHYREHYHIAVVLD